MENLKKIIIPTEMKKNIDNILEEQLFNANRNYSEKNKLISKLMDIELKKSSSEFLKELDYRWKWHNSFYEDLLEPAYLEIVNSNLSELSPKQVQEFIDIYNTCLLVDNVTLVTSASIKKHLEYQFPKMNIYSEDFPKEKAMHMLLTPPIDTFFAQYQIDHIKYIILLKTNSVDTEDYKKILLEKYHCGDEIIFESRFKRDFKREQQLDINSLKKQIEKLSLSNDFKINNFYFTLEHPDRKAYRDLLIYDNITEKFIGFTLIGISGFLFRKKILSYLNDSNILPNNGYIYEFEDEVIIDSLKKLKEKSNTFMEKEIKTYRQTGDTCAIVCMMSILEYYDELDRINSNQEMIFYNNLRSEALIGTPFSTIAEYLSKRDFDVEVIHSNKNLFHNDKAYLDRGTFSIGLEEYQQHLDIAVGNGTKLITNCKIDAELIRKKLEENNMIILAGHCGYYLHAELVCGYNEDKFIVFDPLEGRKKTMSAEELMRYSKTPIGEWCLSIKRKTPTKDKLLSKLQKYDTEAKKKLTLKY